MHYERLRAAALAVLRRLEIVSSSSSTKMSENDLSGLTVRVGFDSVDTVGCDIGCVNSMATLVGPSAEVSCRLRKALSI